ncbi:MAG: hypothetical protein E5W59_22465, partial [Mesorhizobium sp.]
MTRQKVDWQREAARDLSDGRFEEALRAFARNKSVVWASKQDELRGKLVERWAQDSSVGRRDRSAEMERRAIAEEGSAGNKPSIGEAPIED